ncbi:MAG TPA: carcinine hydrolase/isopenicillin-N N-acyltransferase family protein [Bacillota bacterium]|nr:carcinine hydrolase/isopenicillin-N N-acyltransferase family protein [Bacillota bacterium]
MKKIRIMLGGIAMLSLLTWLSGCLIKPTFPNFDPKSLTPDQVKTLASLEKVDDHPLYVMRFYGDYSFALKLKKKYYKQLGLPNPPKCTTFAALNPNGDPLFGRNQDELDHPALLLFTNPPNGYASVCLVNIGGTFGFDTRTNTPFSSEVDRTRLLFTPYFFSDGMNEWGLAIGDMSVFDAKVAFDPNKETMFDTETKRYLLDHAKNVDEALAILPRFNICFPPSGRTTHFLLADPSGNSAVVEWNNGKMVVIRNEHPWQVASNFMISSSQELIKNYTAEYRKNNGKVTNDKGRIFWRYITAWDTLQKMNGLLTSAEAMNLLQTVSLTQSKENWFPTQWSVVYNMKTGNIDIAMGRNYSHVYKYKLEMKK